MAPLPTPAPDVGSKATASEIQASHQPINIPASQSRYSHRLLRREGARYFLSRAVEQAMEDAMNRSIPAPEPVLGKRTRQDDPPDGNDTDPDEGHSSTTVTVERQLLSSSVSNMTVTAAATLRYVSKKKLRPEQRDEVDAFLLDTALGRQAKLFACIMSLENKVDSIRSANDFVDEN